MCLAYCVFNVTDMLNIPKQCVFWYVHVVDVSFFVVFLFCFVLLKFCLVALFIILVAIIAAFMLHFFFVIFCFHIQTILVLVIFFQPRPAEVLVDGKNCQLIRPPDNFEDLMAPYFHGRHLGQHM